MGSKSVELDISKIDKRVIERLVADGKISRAQQEAYLASLPDLVDQARDISEIVSGKKNDEPSA